MKSNIRSGTAVSSIRSSLNGMRISSDSATSSSPPASLRHCSQSIAGTFRPTTAELCEFLARLRAQRRGAGTVICSWPHGDMPAIPVPYATETMHGFEYQAACHLILRGFQEQGLEMVRAVRDRYDGLRRNPWNEIECGSNYATVDGQFRTARGIQRLPVAISRPERSGSPPSPGEGNEFRCFWSNRNRLGRLSPPRQLRRNRDSLRITPTQTPRTRPRRTHINGADRESARRVDAGKRGDPLETEVTVTTGTHAPPHPGSMIPRRISTTSIRRPPENHHTGAGVSAKPVAGSGLQLDLLLMSLAGTQKFHSDFRLRLQPNKPGSERLRARRPVASELEDHIAAAQNPRRRRVTENL